MKHAFSLSRPLLVSLFAAAGFCTEASTKADDSANAAGVKPAAAAEDWNTTELRLSFGQQNERPLSADQEKPAGKSSRYRDLERMVIPGAFPLITGTGKEGEKSFSPLLRFELPHPWRQKARQQKNVGRSGTRFIDASFLSGEGGWLIRVGIEVPFFDWALTKK